MSETNWHALDREKVFELTGANPDGLSQSEVKKRLGEVGYNQLEEGVRKTPLNILLSQFKDIMILILLGAAIISGIIGDLKDTIVILVIVVLNAFVGFIQEYRAEKAMQALKKMTDIQSKVIREGNIEFLAASELVPGDVVILETGSAVPADLRVTKSVSLRIEEAALTGESHPVDKITDPIAGENVPIGDRKNMTYKGTFVAHGRGRGVVVATGMRTELGRIAKMLQGSEAMTPLQKRMASFGRILSIVILALCVVFFFAGWLRGEEVFKMIMTSISLAVAAIPEALPAVITISLALAARRMVRQNTLVRKLPAVETLGSVTYICTDKTGTLTKNKMHVEQVFVDGRNYRNDELKNKKDESISLLLKAFVLNNDAVIAEEEIKGDSTEIALLELATQLGIEKGAHKRLAEIAFDSERKLMTTFHQWEEKIIAIIKGAPDVLFDKCVNLDTDAMSEHVDGMAGEGLRVLGFAVRYWNEIPNEMEPAVVETELQFLGLAGLIDPPREEVIEAVAQCKTAGIVPVMITGDHPLTAKIIAERVGIRQNENDLVVTGQQLASMSEEKFNEEVRKIRVYARVSPEQKLQIVQALQRNGQYVAMTGDGVNDAPSLKKANIGIAMGITGTDVSKEAAHMILLDDNFSTIVKAVREGRRIYDNILKFIKYLMTTNSGEIWTLLLGPIFGLPIALLPIHILWINLVSDGLPAISLSFEKAEKNIMRRPPRPPQESVFARGRGLHIIWVGLLMGAVALGAQLYSINNNLHWQTIVFNIVCLTQMAHVMAIRSERESLFSIGIFSNRPLIASVILVILLQVALTYIPFLQLVFHTEELTLYEFLGVVGASSIIFFAVEIEKLIRRTRENKK